MQSPALPERLLARGPVARWLEPARRHPWRVLALLLMVAGVMLVPWLLWLAGTLPDTVRARNWPELWVGIDIAEAVALVLTGIWVWHRDPRRILSAALAATLLWLDAWVDVTTSSGHTRWLSITLAVIAEIPAGAVCAAIALVAFGALRREASGAARSDPAPAPPTGPSATD